MPSVHSHPQPAPCAAGPGAAPELGPAVRLRAIFVSPGHNYRGHHGGPPGTHPTGSARRVRCLAGRGLEGDRYSRLPDAKGQVTFIAAEDIAVVARRLGLPAIPGEKFRRNLLVEGIDLRTLLGRRFRLQGIEFEGVEECRPCYWMDRAIAPGAEAALEGRGGLRCRVHGDGWLEAEPA